MGPVELVLRIVSLGVLIVAALAGGFVVLLYLSFMPRSMSSIKAEMLAKYDALLPADLRGGVRAYYEQRDSSWSMCASDIYNISHLPVDAIYQRLRADIRHDLAEKDYAKLRARLWQVSPVAEPKPELASHACLTEPDRWAINRLLEGGENLVYVEGGRTGFGNFEFGPQTFFQFLIVIDHRQRLVYVSFWNKEQGG